MQRSFQARHAKVLGAVIALFASAWQVQSAAAQFIFEQSLYGAGVGGGGQVADQGTSVAVSADGNTAITGGPQDACNGFTGCGAAWVFTRSGTSWTQQGSKLYGTSSGNSAQGSSVALSADGNTALVGGYGDNSGIGAAWVFIRSNGVWTQQAKLVGTGTTGDSAQGLSVALSGDGNTAIVGGPFDNSSIGAVWVFTRSGGVWSQQGSKLVGAGAVGNAQQGWSVALSADGTALMTGGRDDNSDAGAAWIFTQNGGTWTQQGPKLVGTGAVGNAAQGTSVALSGDGNTGILGGPGDNSSAGAAWVFTRSGAVWSQQGSKLVGTGAVGIANQGGSVAFSGNGNTAVVGGPSDNNNTGAVWIYTRYNGAWTQQGWKLIGPGSSQSAFQGSSAALSADGNTAVVGGPGDFSFGSTLVFVRAQPTDTRDFNGDGMSDILWRNTAGDVTIWLISGGQISSGPSVGNVPTAWTVVGIRSFNGDAKSGILWRDTEGDAAIWFMNSGQVLSAASLGTVPTNWTVAGTGDFNGDGKADILWQDTAGDVTIWLMNGGQILSEPSLGNVSNAWAVAGTGDFNGDGTTDIVWRNTGGDTTIWLMNAGSVESGISLGNVPNAWSIAGTGDFNGDGTTDILWRNNGGDATIWLMNAGSVQSGISLGNIPTAWTVVATGDYDGDGVADILWRNTEGDVTIWFGPFTGGHISSAVSLGNVPTAWAVQSANSD